MIKLFNTTKSFECVLQSEYGIVMIPQGRFGREDLSFQEQFECIYC